MKHTKQSENKKHLEHTGNLEGFLDFCQYQRSMSINTLRAYQYDLAEYLRWLQERSLDPVTVKTRDVESFFIWLRKETGNTIQTTNRKMYALRSFYRWLLRQEIINRSPLEHFRNVRTPKMLPKYLTPAEQEAFINASIPSPINASTDDSHNDGNGQPKGRQRSYWMGLRDHLLTILLLDAGLRISEACGVELKDLNLDEGILTVIGKGSKQREVVLSERVIRTAREYIDMVNDFTFNHAVGPQLPSRGLTMRKVSEDMGIISGSLIMAVHRGSDNSAILERFQTYVDDRVMSQPMKYLFFNQMGKPLSTRHAFRIILDIGNKAGIAGLHPHTLRHTYATNLRRKGGDLLLIKEALGHSSVSTTEIYAHMGNQEYKENLRRLVN